MIKKIIRFLVAGGLFMMATTVQAQFENSGVISNAGSVIECYSSWTNAAAATYTGSNTGVVNHHSLPGVTFVNNGAYSANSGHKDAFKGTLTGDGPHEIGGTKRPAFFDVDFINGAASVVSVTNTEGIGISGKLSFQNGVTTTSRILHEKGSVRFEAGASFENAVTDGQHVNGYVSKLGNTAFTFPVGSGTDLRSVQISAPSNAAALISLAWIPGNPGSTTDPSDISPYHAVTSVAEPLGTVSPLGQWDWIQVVAPTNALTIKVSIPDVSAFTSVGKLRLAGWNGTTWIDLSGGQTASGTTENSTITGVIPANSTISALGIGSTSGSLPVKLVSFVAVISEKTNTALSWVTSSEINNNFFEVEHALDAQVFAVVGKIDAKKSATATNNYSFLHKLNDATGQHYYRLKQVDLDGSYSYSQIRSVDFAGPAVKVYPNPANQTVNIEVPDWQNISSTELFDASGRKVYGSGQKVPLHGISVLNLSSGTYTIRLQYLNGSLVNKKVIVIK